jgi:hypothetical protein
MTPSGKWLGMAAFEWVAEEGAMLGLMAFEGSAAQ